MSTPLKGVIKFKPETTFGVHPGKPLRGFEPQPVTTLQGSLEINYVNKELLQEYMGGLGFVSTCNLGKLTVRMAHKSPAFEAPYGKHVYGDYTNFYKAFANMTTKRKVKRAANILVKANRRNGKPCDPRKTYRELAKFARGIK